MRGFRGAVSFLLVLVAASTAASSKSPVAVSPGAFDRAAAASRCPTFSWAAADDPSGLELAVFQPADDGGLGEPVIREVLARGATSWTPPADGCLPPGRYAWSIRSRVRTGDEPQDWAVSRWFTVDDASATSGLEAAVERVLERWLAAGKLTGPPSSPQDVRLAIADEPIVAPTDTPSGASADGPPSFVADTTLFDPPDCQQDTMFQDVPQSDSRCEFIEQFANDQIATACAAGPRFCPDDPVRRGDLAVYLERAMRGTNVWNANFALRNATNTFTAANTFNGASNFPGSGIWNTNGRVGIGTTSPASPLDIQLAANQHLEFRYEGNTVPGINVNTTSNAGIMRFHNGLEVWPSDDQTRAGKIDVRDTDFSARIVLNGDNGNVTANNLAALREVTGGGSVGVPIGQETTLVSATVTAPASGYLLLVCSGDFISPDGTVSLVRFYEGATVLDERLFVGSGGQLPLTMMKAISTGAGTRTFAIKWYNGDTSTSGVVVFDPNLTILFFPNTLAP